MTDGPTTPPCLRAADLTEADWCAVDRLLQAPAWWAFAVLAGLCGGIDRAIEACRTRTLDSAQASALAQGSWTVDSLPAYDDVATALLGCRLDALRRDARRRRKQLPPLVTLAAELGTTVAVLRRAERMMEGV